MGKLTDEQAATLAELKRLAEAPDDEELELYVKDEAGRETRLTGSYAQKWLQKLGLGDDEPAGDGDKPEDKADGDKAEADTDDPPAKAQPRWFR